MNKSGLVGAVMASVVGLASVRAEAACPIGVVKRTYLIESMSEHFSDGQTCWSVGIAKFDPTSGRNLFSSNGFSHCTGPNGGAFEDVLTDVEFSIEPNCTGVIQLPPRTHWRFVFDRSGNTGHFIVTTAQPFSAEGVSRAKGTFTAR